MGASQNALDLHRLTLARGNTLSANWRVDSVPIGIGALPDSSHYPAV
jgi:hypothetical protein